MQRSVSSHLVLDVERPALLALLIAVASGTQRRVESLSVTCDGRLVEVAELGDRHGGRIHRVQAPTGRIEIDYRATVHGVDAAPPVDELDLLSYRRPSRYADSDRMVGIANVEFAGLSGEPLLGAVVQWVAAHVSYVSGSSGPTDGASDTLLSGQGVCRDFAHLTVSVLRALDVPARLAAVYAPGLSPMDFHAVTEAYVDDRWCVVDPTHLAPRSSLVRISTGRDAADTAFLSAHHGLVTLLDQEVTAVVDGALPTDDGVALVALR